jgi:hypothetical protein
MAGLLMDALFHLIGEGGAMFACRHATGVIRSKPFCYHNARIPAYRIQ